MAKCKLCKTNIPDGKEYCENCQDSGKVKANESYLDSLLNSVKNTSSAADSVYYKKKQDNSNIPISSPGIGKDKEETEPQDYMSYDVDLKDIEDFDKFYMENDLEDLPNDIIIGDKELFGEDLTSFMFDEIMNSSNKNLNEKLNNKTMMNATGNQVNIDNKVRTSLNESDFGIAENELLDKELINNDTENKKLKNKKLKNNELKNKELKNRELKNKELINNELENQEIENQEIEDLEQKNEELQNEELKNEKLENEELENEKLENEELENKELENNDQINNDPVNNEPENNELVDKESKDILTMDFGENSEKEITATNMGRSENSNELNYNSGIDESENRNSIRKEADANVNPDEIEEFHEDEYDQDLNDLLNSLDTYDDKINNEKNDKNDVQEPIAMDKEEDFEQLIPEDEDFLSLLNQISSDDPVAEDVKAINELLNGTSNEAANKATMPSDVGEVFSDALKAVSSLHDNDLDEAQLLNQIPEKGKKGKKAKKQKATKKKTSKNAGDETQDKPKVGFFKRLFGNVKDENTKKEKKQSKVASEEGDVPLKPDKKAKPAKGKKGKTAPEASEAEGKGKAGKDAQEEGKGGKAGKKGAKKEKKEKKEKKPKNKEIIQVIDEIEEDEGRINRLGASIVFIFFGLLALLIYFGTNVVSYTLSIDNATNYFDNQKYNQAYSEVYGIDIKDKDIEIYDKIMTVMFVNKQLNSYNNYYSIGEYPQALDSLLKGLKRYDKYIELATILGIDTDLDYVRTQILAELQNVFHLSEKQAVKINALEDMSKYSMEVYNIVLENKNN